MAACLLTGYVVAPLKVLRSWSRTASVGALPPPVAVPVRLDGVDGRLLVASPGRHSLEIDGRRVGVDPGLGVGGPLAPLWRATDLFALHNLGRLAEVLTVAGVDLSRAGLARTSRSIDGVAHTLGSRGEGEPELPQVWFARAPLWPCRVVAVGGDAVEIGPRGPGAWPAWFDLPDGRRLDVLGVPVPWAGPAPLPSILESPAMPLNWRRAF